MISVTDPIQRSIDRTREVLFAPFAFGKWCAMGFTVFLANFLSGGGGSGGNFNRSKRMAGGETWGGRAPLEALDLARTWVLGHLGLVVTLAALVLILILVLQWLGSRGQFMFLDNVVNNRGQVVEPWKRFREHGNRVFLFNLLLSLAGLALFAACGYAAWRLARPDILAEEFGAAAVRGLLVAVGTMLPLALVLGMTGLVLRDFVIPVMYLRGCTVGEGFKAFWSELLPGRSGSFALFYLLKLCLSVAAFIVIMFGSCLTCCMAGLPYVSSVVFLPIFVFFRAYSLYFMAQCGQEWQMLP